MRTIRVAIFSLTAIWLLVAAPLASAQGVGSLESEPTPAAQEAEHAKTALESNTTRPLPPPVSAATRAGKRKIYLPPGQTVNYAAASLTSRRGRPSHRHGRHLGRSAGARASHYVPQTALRFNNGYVQHHPHVYVVFWGSEWNEKPGTKEKILALYRWLGGSTFGSILTQYPDHTGPVENDSSLVASYTDQRTVAPHEVEEEKILNEIHYSLNNIWSEYPRSYENQYVVFTPPGAMYAENSECAYHNWDGEPWQISWTITPWQKSKSCLGGLEEWAALQVTASHEWAESATDPIPYDPFGGWDNSHPGSEIEENEEIADRCEETGTESVEATPGIFVQKIFDNYLDSATGFYCVAQDANPSRYGVVNNQPTVGLHTATLNGEVNPAGWPAYYQFEFVHGTEVTKLPASPGTVSEDLFGYTPVSQSVSGLKGSTTYNVRLNSTSLLTTSIRTGEVATFSGAEQTFTTPDWRPAVTTGAASSVTSTGATLNGSVNPNGTETKYFFEYGHTTAYGTKTTETSVGSGGSAVPVSKALTSLEFGTTYHYRIVASNSEGTSYGADQSFTPGWYMQSAANPEGAQTGGLVGVSCSSATECTGVGQYTNSGGATVSLAERWNGTKWTVQSTPNPSGEYASYLSGVSCPGTSSCLAVGHYVSTSHTEPNVQKALAERWDGSKWELLTPATPEGGKQPTLQAVACAAVSDCTATGNYINGSGTTVPLAEHWNGTSWSVQSTPSPEGATSSSLAAISCSSSSACTAVGKSTKAIEHQEPITTTLAERWNGTSWSIQTTPNPSGSAPALEGVSCASATECIAVGQYASSGEKVLAERWNGTSWSLQTITNPEGFSTAYLAGVSCTSSLSCIAVGYTGEIVNHTETVKTLGERWNGVKWEAQSPLNVESGSTIRSSLTGVSCKSSTECNTVGSNEPSTGVNVPLAEGYFKSPPPTVTTKAASAITESGATLNGSVNPNGTATTYFFEYGPTTSYGTNTAEVSAGSGTTVVEVSKAIAGLEAGTRYHYRIVASNGGGTTKGEDQTFVPGWTLHLPPNPEGAKETKLGGVSCTAANECSTAGSYVNSAGTLLTLAERWNGTSWAIQSTPNPSGATSSSLNGVSCSSSTACTAVGSSTKTGEHGESTTTTLAERWNGTSWSIQTTPNPSGTAPALEGVSCAGASECTAVGQYTSSGKKVLAERWNGTSWSIQTISNPEGISTAYLTGVSCASSSSCIAVGYTGEAVEQTATVKTLAERWNGTSWEVQTPPNAEGGSPIRNLFAGVSCKSATECTAVGNYQNSSGVVVGLAEGY